MLCPKRVKLPQVIYISSANYSEGTKILLKEFKDNLIRKNVDFTYIDILKSDFDLKNIKEDFEKEYKYLGLGKVFDYKPYCYAQADIDATMMALNYYNEIKKQQEETKMDAKKCDKCGKLYEDTNGNNYPIKAFLCGRVTDYEKNTYAQEKIKEVNTYDISIVFRSGTKMDLCPECREKLKNFFESGNDETTVIKKAEE